MKGLHLQSKPHYQQRKSCNKNYVCDKFTAINFKILSSRTFTKSREHFKMNNQHLGNLSVSKCLFATLALIVVHSIYIGQLVQV